MNVIMYLCVGCGFRDEFHNLKSSFFSKYFKKNPNGRYIAMSATNTSRTISDMSRILGISIPVPLQMWGCSKDFLWSDVKIILHSANNFK